MSEHEDDDAALMARAIHEFEAFEVLYRRYVRRVAGFAARRCATAEDVADVVAQTFVRLLRSASRYDPGRGAVASFVFTIAESEVADHRRRARRQRDLVTRLATRDLLGADDIARIEAAIDASAAVADLEPALEALPAAENEVLRLVASGLSPSEAARQLAITPNAARVRLSRARRRLRPHGLPNDRNRGDQ
jgi:RNA polymerase sigma factor (sigma-70 family)